MICSNSRTKGNQKVNIKNVKIEWKTDLKNVLKVFNNIIFSCEKRSKVTIKKKDKNQFLRAI